MEPDTSNKFLVGLAGVGFGSVHVLNPAALRPMSQDDAILLAAWLVALADPGGEKFQDILKRVLST